MLFTFPSRYWFAIGHGRVFSLGGWSPLVRTGFHVSGPTRVPPSQAVRAFAYGAVTLFRAPFQASSASPPLCNWPRGLGAPGIGGPTTPRAATPPGFTACTGLGSSPLSLAATRGISFDFSSSGYLDVSVPPVVPARPMSSGGRARALPRAGFPIRRPAGRRPFAPLRRLSQLVASFFGFPCQGIRRVPLVSSRTFSFAIVEDSISTLIYCAMQLSRCSHRTGRLPARQIAFRGGRSPASRALRSGTRAAAIHHPSGPTPLGSP